MTINKAQVQTLNYVGIFLPKPVFSYEQLYVALSRAKKLNSIKILVKLTLSDNLDYDCTKNIVYHELLMIMNS